MKDKLFTAVAAIALALCSAGGAWADQGTISLSFLNPASSRSDDLASYSKQLQQAIGNHWQNLESFGAHAPVEVLFQIRPDGSLLNASISKSSGVAQFDQQILSAVRSCVPFRAPPLGAVRLLNVVGTFHPSSAPTASSTRSSTQAPHQDETSKHDVCADSATSSAGFNAGGAGANPASADSANKNNASPNDEPMESNIA